MLLTSGWLFYILISCFFALISHIFHQCLLCNQLIQISVYSCLVYRTLFLIHMLYNIRHMNGTIFIPDQIIKDHLSALCLIFMFTFHLNSCFLSVLKSPLCKLLFYAVSIYCHSICLLLHILSILYLPTAYSNYCCTLSCICTGTP